MQLEWESQVLDLLEQALALPPAQRLDWLHATTTTPEVRQRVLSLLAMEETSGGFLETPVAVAFDQAGTGWDLPEPGSRLGAWELLRQLDSGGMGVVFLARRADGAYQQQAAIKFVYTDHLVLDPRHRAELVARFENERQLLARLEHPNIARILDGGETAAGQPWLAMEYVDGPSLLAWCELARLDVSARVDLFRKVCAGVQAAHRHLIVHRDLKPHNILVGSDGEPRLLDFGIARLLDVDAAGAGTSTRTQTRFIAMTPAYASPEQLRQESLTTASDIYSLGVVLFELLAGTRPYRLDGMSSLQGERLISTGSRPALRKALLEGALPDAERRARLARIGSDLERIVGKAMHPDPERRYESAQALADDLQRHLDGRPVTAHPDTLGYRIGKFVRRHRLGTAAAALALTAILVASGIAFRQADQARRAAQDMAQVNRFLVDVLNVSNPFSSGSELTLADAVDEAAGKIDERFAGRVDLSIDIRNTLGESLQARFRPDAAAVQFERAVADGERLFGQDDLRVLVALNGLAAVRRDQERMSEAAAMYEEVLQRIERSDQTALPIYGRALNDLGVLHLALEDPEHAADYLQRSLDAIALVPDGEARLLMAENRALTMISLAQAQRALGDLDRASELYDQSQQVLEGLHPEGSPQLGIVLNSRARLAQDRGDLTEAVALQKQSIAMLEKTLRSDHVHTLVAMVHLVRLGVAVDDLALAEAWAIKSVAMADRLYGQTPTSAVQINVLSALAALRRAQGRTQEASSALVSARDLLAIIESVPASTRDRVTGQITELCAEPESPSLPVCR